MNLPTSEIEAIRYFSNEDRCIKFVAEQRWPNCVVCPTCGRVDVSYLKMHRRWQCKSAHPKRQFSVKTGTIFEDSPLGLSKWLPAVWKIVNSKNGVSSYEMAASLQITQKSAWFLNHRIREALKAGSFEKLSGAVEADETYVGGKSHTGKRHDMSNKTAVIGIVEKQKGTGRLRAYATKYVDSTETFRFLNAAVEPGSTLHTDESRIYHHAGRTFKHEKVNHGHKEYARGGVSTNTIEGVWNLFKRSHRGTYTHLSAKHLNRYVQEHVYRYNMRQSTGAERFVAWFAGSGKRLGYRVLVSS